MSNSIPEVNDRVRICYTKHPFCGKTGVIHHVDRYGECITIRLQDGSETKVGCEDYEYLGRVKPRSPARKAKGKKDILQQLGIIDTAGVPTKRPMSYRSAVYTTRDLLLKHGAELGVPQRTLDLTYDVLGALGRKLEER